jgi:cyclopropane fatty-acyl-phospholipid synthase-like methyltransferase
MRPTDYLRESALQMNQIESWIAPHAKVLEYGCGLGGNLMAISDRIGSGVGVDVNGGYLRLARRLQRRVGASNLTFLPASSFGAVPAQDFDFAFSIGLFERITKPMAIIILERISNSLRTGARAALYFLTERFRGTDFLRQLGPAAYFPWQRQEIQAALESVGLYVSEYREWLSPRLVGRTVADLVIVTKGRVGLRP